MNSNIFEINGTILSINKKNKRNFEGVYYLINFLEENNDDIKKIFVFDEELKKEIENLKDFENYKYKFLIKKQNNFLNLIKIENKIKKEETRKQIEEKVLTGLYKYYNEPLLINKYKKILYSRYFKENLNKKCLKDILDNDGKIIEEDYPFLKENYKLIDEILFEKYINKLIEIFNKEQKEELKKKIINGEKINYEDLIKNNVIDTSLEEISVSNLLMNNVSYIYEYKNKETLGNPTGLKKLDQVIDGVFGLVGLTGVPGSGKTSLALQIADYNSQINNPVLYISLEINLKLFLMKWASFKSQTKMKQNMKEALSYEDALKFYSALEEILNKDNFYLIDKSFNPTFEKIEKYIKEIQKKEKDKQLLVVVDYLNIFNEESVNNIKDKNEKMAVLMEKFIDLKNRTQANFLIILAKNKQGYKSAEMASIKGDNNLEYGLETILSLEDPKNIDIEENIDTLDFNIVAVIFKNRWGENFRKIPLKFEGHINRFFEVKY